MASNALNINGRDIKVSSKPGDRLGYFKQAIYGTMPRNNLNAPPILGMNDLDTVLSKSDSKTFGAAFNNTQDFIDYTNNVVENLQDALTNPDLQTNKDSIINYVKNSATHIDSNGNRIVGPQRNANGNWNLPDIEEEFSPRLTPEEMPSVPESPPPESLSGGAGGSAGRQTPQTQAASGAPDTPPVTPENVESVLQGEERTKVEQAAKKSVEDVTQEAKKKGEQIIKNKGEKASEKAAEEAAENVLKKGSWKKTAAIAVGAMALGAGLHKLLSNDRGQQSNAQLYGQQPLY